jgi:hypothetical protein
VKNYNNVGKGIICSSLEVIGEGSSRMAYLKQVVDAERQKVDYGKLVQNVDNLASDNILTPSEAQALYRQFKSIESAYALLMSQSETYGFTDAASASNADYQALVSAYTALSTTCSPLFADMTKNQTVDGAALSTVFTTYYVKAQVIDSAVFNILNDVSDMLTLTLSCLTFSYDWRGNARTLDDGSVQSCIVTVSEQGIGQALVLAVNGTAVTLDASGKYVVPLSAMEGRTFVLLHATCGGHERENLITRLQEEAPAISVQVFSPDGYAFRAGNATGKIYAYVYQGEDDITDTLETSAFRWKRVTGDTAQDGIWNTSSKALTSGKVLDVTPDDCIGRTVFTVEVTV